MKKITALFLAVILAVAIAVPAFADDVAVFEISSATIEAGQSATLDVYLTSNPGIAGGTISISPESPLTITQTKKASPSLFSGFQAARNVVFDEDGNVYDTGKFCTITVSVPADCTPGDYEINIIFREVINEDYDDVACTCVPATITVPGAAAPETVEVSMSATPKDSAVVAANFYVKLPSTAEADNYSFAVDNVATSFAGLTADAENGYKFSVPTDAKKMGDLINVKVYEGDEAVFDQNTSIALYAQALIAGEFAADVKAVASAMLVYGAAAQTYFGYNADALVTNAVAEAPVVGSAFVNTPLIAAVAGSPVKYVAMSLNCLSDITLSMAFQVIGDDVNAALAWVEENVVINGQAADATAQLGNNGRYNYIIVKVEGITLDEVFNAMDITVGGVDAGAISVLNYLYAVEAAYANNPAKAGIVNLVRGLYAYAAAVSALAD
jgi:hypothetical protein